jgi:alkylation response protein AidB-like acyl-CoA dehydrogenase
MNPALDACLRAPTQVPPRASVAEWWPRWRQGAALAATPAEQALRGGFDADRVGWAFATGYQAALRALLPQLPADTVAAFCVTEETGNRPRDIHTRFTPQADGSVSITGAKRWTTLGPDAACC